MLCHFLEGFQLVGPDIAQQRLHITMAGEFADIKDIHTGQVHQRCARTPCRVGGNEFILGLYCLLNLASLGGRYLHRIRQAGLLADFLDVLIKFLVPEEGELVRILAELFIWLNTDF